MQTDVFSFSSRSFSSLTHISETKTQVFLCIFNLFQNVRAWLHPASQKCVCKSGVSVMLIVSSCLWEKNMDIHYPCTWQVALSKGDTVVNVYFFFFFLVSIRMEFLTIETVSYTFSLELYKQFKPYVHTTASCCGRPKPQQSDQKEKWTTSWCPDWSGHCFSASSALQNNSGYQQLTTFLLYF